MMDDFLRDIHTLIFKQWILCQSIKGCKMSLKTSGDEEEIYLETERSFGKAAFHKNNVIELVLENRQTGSVDFYLHFQMQTLKHAAGLFHELVNTMIHAQERKKLRILLSCTSGLTTSFFAESLNDAARTIMLDYEFSAVSFNELADQGNDYDVILLAPQIAYQQAYIQSVLHRVPVEAIAPHVFAQYDCGAIFKQIELALKKDIPEVPLLQLKVNINYPEKILSIGVLKSRIHAHIVYRVYQQEEILTNGEMIKPNIDIHDYNDIVNLCLLEHPDLKIVGIAMPGIIQGGHLTMLGEGFDHCDVVGYLRNKHPNISFSLDNDVNAIVSGIYAVNTGYDTMSFYFLPKGNKIGGVGNIFKGQIVKGRQNIAGEVQYLPLNYSKSTEELAKTIEGSTEIVAKTLVSIISILGPDLIAYYCSNVPSIDDLKEEMSRYIPDEYIPVIKKIDNMQEYILFGEMIMCIMRVENA